MGAVVTDGDELVGEVEIDGAYFVSRIRPANRLADRRQQRARTATAKSWLSRVSAALAERSRGWSAGKVTRSR